MNPQAIHEKMAVYVCTFEIRTDDGVQTRVMKAPRLMLEREFISLVNDVANCTFPVKVKMSRTEPVWNQFDNEWVEREYSIEFANNAYADSHDEF